MSIIEPRRRGRPRNKIPRKPERKLYKIDQVIRLLGITGRTIRYYDQLGLLPYVKRSDGGIRLFDDQDVELIKKIRKMQKEAHLSLTKIRELLFKTSQGVEDTSRWIVLTDSTASLPEELVDRLPIEIMPLELRVESEKFSDVKVQTRKLWEKSKSTEGRPSVTAPTEAAFIQKYRQLANQGFSRVYSIHASAEVSDTYKNAVAAGHKVAAEIEVLPIDSRSIGGGLGLLVKLIAESIANEEFGMEIGLLLEKQLPLVFGLHMISALNPLVLGEPLPQNYVSPDTPPQPLLDKIFQFKPVMSIKHSTGDFEVLECCKDKLAGMRLIIGLLEAEIKARGGYIRGAVVSYNHLYGEAVELVNEIKTRYHNAEVLIAEASASFSVYAGPETLSISII